MSDGTEKFPVLPLRDIVVFPHMIVPLFVGRDKSVNALEAVMQSDKKILLVSQLDAGNDSPGIDDVYRIGTIATVLQLLKLPDGTVKVLVEGMQRAVIKDIEDGEEYFESVCEVVHEPDTDSDEVEALMRTVVSQFEQYTKLNKNSARGFAVSKPDRPACEISGHYCQPLKYQDCRKTGSA